MIEIKVWPDTGQYGETIWCAKYPGGMCSTSGEDAEEWVVSRALENLKLKDLDLSLVNIVKGHYEKVWVEDNA